MSRVSSLSACTSRRRRADQFDDDHRRLIYQTASDFNYGKATPALILLPSSNILFYPVQVLERDVEY
jgi:hypothetical protein